MHSEKILDARRAIGGRGLGSRWHSQGSRDLGLRVACAARTPGGLGVVCTDPGGCPDHCPEAEILSESHGEEGWACCTCKLPTVAVTPTICLGLQSSNSCRGWGGMSPGPAGAPACLPLLSASIQGNHVKLQKEMHAEGSRPLRPGDVPSPSGLHFLCP